MITKYGLNTFLISAGFSVILIIISLFISNGWIKYPLLLLGIAFLLFNLNFFRDPERTPPKEKDVIISPADGKIVIVKDVFEKRFLESEATQVSIFMSPLNVHVNRIPVDGRVDFLNYIKGDYLVAFHEKADLRNERSEIGITGRYGKMLFTQVAGFIARRIVFDLKLGDQVTMGDRFGMIKFGSRSDVIVPKGWKLNVKLGDIVTAGETILFEYADE
ncbi:MAG TPA: phosphatidylserine decarboxylase family protein [Melioribacteraceae bacterium]|nr:phosphatidylserine decarboxylase family protein [Melioribacteraceae bacterium]